MALSSSRNTLATLLIGGATIPALSGCGEALIAGAILESSRARNQANLESARATVPAPEMPSWVDNNPLLSKDKIGFSASNSSQRFDGRLSLYYGGVFVDSPSGGWVAMPYTRIVDAGANKAHSLGALFGNPDTLYFRDRTGRYFNVLFKQGDPDLDFYLREINDRR